MSSLVRCLVLILLCIVPALRADVTLRYKSEVQIAPFLPPEALDQFNKSMKKGMAENSQVIRMKGSKAISSTGKFSSLVDFDKRELTMIDGENKRVSTVPVDKFSDSWTASIPELPEQARKAFESMKVNMDSRKTGRTDTIQGVQAEEREAILSMEMPMSGSDQPVAIMKMVMQIWTAKPEEALRVQAIRELTAYNLWTNYFMNPGQSMEKMFRMMPGFGEGMTKMFTELSQNKSVMLRTEMKVYSSFLGQMAQSMQKNGKALPPGYDPDAPLIQMSQEAAELSTATIEDAMFRIPEGHEAVPMADLMKALTTPPKVLP